MKLLWHKDMLRLLRSWRSKDRSDDVAKLLDSTRKHCNSNYKAVVVGARPSRAQKSDQQVAASMSRQTAKDYWLARIKGEL